MHYYCRGFPCTYSTRRMHYYCRSPVSMMPLATVVARISPLGASLCMCRGTWTSAKMYGAHPSTDT